MAGLTTGARTNEERANEERAFGARTNVQGCAKEGVMCRGVRMGVAACVAALTGALGSGLGGCSTPVTVGDQVATYTGTTLMGTIEGVRVPSVIAATEQAMLARGYSIVESASTEESGQIIGRPPRYNTYPRMRVGAAQVGDGVRVSLTYEPFGDREVCAAMYDAILRRLGQ